VKIIHVMGPMLSGKTFLIQKAQEKYDIPAFNIKQMHIEAGSIDKDGNFNWEVFRKHRQEKLITTKLTQFLINNRDKEFVFLESSGGNQEINDVLKTLKWADVIPIPLTQNRRWKEFAEKEGIDKDKVIDSTKYFYRTVEYELKHCLTQKEAANKIKEVIVQSKQTN